MILPSQLSDTFKDFFLFCYSIILLSFILLFYYSILFYSVIL